jgi:hypothetical protein
LNLGMQPYYQPEAPNRYGRDSPARRIVNWAAEMM